jgi:hypothetical protein
MSTAVASAWDDGSDPSTETTMVLNICRPPKNQPIIWLV